MTKPFSQPCENNKHAILDILNIEFSQAKNVLEIGSGTGQHAIFFAPALPHLTWHTSDLIENHQGINQWIDEHPSSNIKPPLNLDLNEQWPIAQVDKIYSANTLHIVSWQLVTKFFEGVKKHLLSDGRLCIYGPFNYGGKFTSDSNAKFDLWLKDRNQESGIRDIEAIIELATLAQLSLINDIEMPANNRMLVFKKH